jgi:hypothetical protein
VRAICIFKNCVNMNCAHRGEHEHNQYCGRISNGVTVMNCKDSRCAPVGLIAIAKERPYEKFPTGWPIRCPNCGSWSFFYTSENTGNIRRYRCKDCNDMYLAAWKGPRITSVMGEPQNTRMEQWEWARIINRLPEAKT